MGIATAFVISQRAVEKRTANIFTKLARPRIEEGHRRPAPPPRVGCVPSLIRLVSAVLAEQSDEWTEGRRYMSLDLLTKSRIRIIPAEPNPTTSEPTMTTGILIA